jgi:hypothetical protein
MQEVGMRRGIVVNPVLDFVRISYLKKQKNVLRNFLQNL